MTSANVQAETHYDVIIIGGGLVGASLACALQSQHMTIAVVEPFPLRTSQQPSYDDRTVALSFGSRKIFEALGLWEKINERAEAIKNIHISDRGHFGVTRLDCEEEGVEALGYVAENQALGEAMYQRIEASDNVTLLCPAKLVEFSVAENNATSHNASDNNSDNAASEKPIVNVVIEDGDSKRQITTNLLVGADGQRSQVKQFLQIGDVSQDYNQTAIIANVTPGKRHNNVAYERFTEKGPVAFLPMQNNRCSVVWTLPHSEAEKMLALDETEFLVALQQAFGYRLGQFKKAGQRQIYPLMLQEATQVVQRGVVIVGNAAHTLHPVAGQGFNLALRDVALLAEMLIQAFQAGENLGSSILLNRYAEQREQDINRVYRFTDSLVKIFSSSFTPLAHCRSLGLFAVDVLPDIKHVLAMQSMGLSGRLSRLKNAGIEHGEIKEAKR